MATRVGSSILARDPGEGRVLVLGLGLSKGFGRPEQREEDEEDREDVRREGFWELIELVEKVL